MKKLLLLYFSICFSGLAAASGSQSALDEVVINLRDHYSIQRGAKIFANYCQGCHSLQYMRYNRFAKDNLVTNPEGEVLEDILRKSLMFNTDKVGAPMLSSMDSNNGKKWFGATPPDLSLTVRKRGKDWVYSYLRAFYVDDIRPWGVNNAVFPDVGMPNVFQDLQGIQKPVFKTLVKEVDGKKQELHHLDHLTLVEQGSLSPKEFDRLVTDLVGFMAYVAEPMKMERQRVGVWVILFLIFFAGLAYLLKKEFWRDVH